MKELNKEDWFRVKDEASIDSPALLIYADRVDANIRACLELAGSADRLRPHIKTCKSSAVVKKMLAAGITRFKCATIAEAELLGQVGAADVLLAYQLTKRKAMRWLALMERYPATRFATVIDNSDTAVLLSEMATTSGSTLSVYIDLNVGMNRTGIVPELALALYKEIAALPSLQLLGLHAYDGHINDANETIRKEQMAKAFAPADALRESIVAAGLHKPSLIAGGSPTYPLHVVRPDQECSPGTFVFWDASYLENYPEQPFIPAALILTRVVSIPSPGRYCIDLGHKAVSAEMALEKRVRLVGLPDVQIIGHSEEHMVITTSTLLRIGDTLYALPHHICPSVALHEFALAIEEGLVVDRWPIEARKRLLTI